VAETSERMNTAETVDGAKCPTERGLADRRPPDLARWGDETHYDVDRRLLQ
jgi:hypothetical protein